MDMNNLDWESLFTAMVEAGVVMIVALLGAMLTFVALILALLLWTPLYWLIMTIAFAILTTFFYKYEKAVDDL